MESVATRVPGQLTLGEIRRFEFARAMANRPRVLLVDEPSSGMTSDEAILLARSLRSIADSGVAVIVIEHNIPFIRSLASRMVVLDAGRIIARGETSAVLASNVVKEAYLGTSTAA
jgi:branched-chain amino acid transport system ATP-binding protein